MVFMLLQTAVQPTTTQNTEKPYVEVGAEDETEKKPQSHKMQKTKQVDGFNLKPNNSPNRLDLN